MPSFLTDILEQLGWSDGTFLPVSNQENKELELLLEERNKELIKLKAETDAQDLKQNELEQHRKNLLAEYKENMHLLVIHKEQMENEEHYSKVAVNELEKMSKDVVSMDKQYADIDKRIERLQSDIARVLRQVENRRSGIGMDRTSLEEWRAALKRGGEDIGAIEKFSKQDDALIQVMEDKRRRLKIEYDKKQAELVKLCGDLSSEEKIAEKVANLVVEALQQRRSTIATWAGAVENLRQRDKDIKQMRQDLEMQREYGKQKNELMLEKQEFLNAQNTNNAEAERDLLDCKTMLAQERMNQAKSQETLKTLDNELLCLKRELMSTAIQLNNMRAENKRMSKEKYKKEEYIENLRDQIDSYKLKLTEVTDGFKTAAQRYRQLEEMLSNEEKYIKHVTNESERLQHCVFRCQQELERLQEEANMSQLLSRGYRMATVQMENKLVNMDKELLVQKEILYKVSYNVERMASRLGILEGSQVDYEEEERLGLRAEQLEKVLKERTEAVIRLNAHIVQLTAQERLAIHSIREGQHQMVGLKDRMQEQTACSEGGQRCLREARREARARRAEEGALRLRAEHAERAVRRLGDQGISIEKAALGLKAAVRERSVEAQERLSVLKVQRRTLTEERGQLYGDLRSQELQVEQLKAKYEVCLSTLGKDDSGDPLTVTYFKVKNAQEKSELQQEGDALDAQIRKNEKEISALEATLSVVDLANRNFIRNLAPSQDNDPEVVELNSLVKEFNRCREQRSQLLTQCTKLSQQVEMLRNDIASLAPQDEALHSIREGLMIDISTLRRELCDQEDKLSRATVQCNKAKIAAKRKVKEKRLMEMYALELELRAVVDANRSAAAQLRSLDLPEVEEHARRMGVNLTLIHSGSLSSMKVLSQSSKSSVISEDSTMIQHGYPSSISEEGSETGGDGSGPSSRGIRDRLWAVRAPRQPLSPSAQSTSRESRIGDIRSGSKHSVTASSSVPINIVRLDLDTEPVRDGPSSSSKSKKTCKAPCKGPVKSSSSNK